MKNNNSRILIVAAALGLPFNAANAQWLPGPLNNGGVDPLTNVYSNGNNWAGGTVNGNFANASTITTLSVGSEQTGNLSFNNANTAAYTLGTAANVGNFTYGSGGGISVTSAVTTNQIINSAVYGTLNRTTNMNLVLTASGSGGSTLTLNGEVGGRTTSTGAAILELRGTGLGIINGVVSNGAQGGTTSVLKNNGSGKWTLNEANTYSGGTTLSLGELALGNKSALGTGELKLLTSSASISAGSGLTGANAVANAIKYDSTGSLYLTTTFKGANNMEFSGPVNLNATATTGYVFMQVDSGITTTLSGVISETNKGVLTKTGTGALALSGDNTFTGNTTVTGGTLLLNSQTGSSTGGGGLTIVQTGATIAGNGRTSGLIQVDAGATLRIGGTTGESTGVLTSTNASSSALVLNASSSTFIDINGATRGTEYDAFETVGRVNYGGDIDADFGSLAAIGTTVYNLFDFASIGGSDFNSFDITGAYTASLTLSGAGGTGIWTGNSGPDTTFSFAQSTGDLTVIVIPEPGAAMLLGGLGGLFLFRRRIG